MSSLVLPMADPLQIVSFVHRGCKGELVGQDWQRMNELLVELTPENLSTTLEKCYDNHRSQRMFYVICLLNLLFHLVIAFIIVFILYCCQVISVCLLFVFVMFDIVSARCIQCYNLYVHELILL